MERRGVGETAGRRARARTAEAIERWGKPARAAQRSDRHGRGERCKEAAVPLQSSPGRINQSNNSSNEFSRHKGVFFWLLVVAPVLVGDLSDLGATMDAQGLFSVR